MQTRKVTARNDRSIAFYGASVFFNAFHNDFCHVTIIILFWKKKMFERYMRDHARMKSCMINKIGRESNLVVFNFRRYSQWLPGQGPLQTRRLKQLNLASRICVEHPRSFIASFTEKVRHCYLSAFVLATASTMECGEKTMLSLLRSFYLCILILH